MAGHRILLIEDNEDAVAAMKSFLELSGHSVDVAHDALGGIEKARESRPDVILCDIGLPGDADGYRVARTLRRSEGFDSTLLIALTGHAREEDAAEAIEAGFDLHLAKPVDGTVLVETIAQGLSSAT